MVTEARLVMGALIASDTYGPVLIPQIINAGADLPKGTILGRITASGKFKKALTASTDGSEDPVGILTEDTPATAEDVGAVVGFAGVYAESGVTGLTDEYKLALEAKGIYFV